MRLLTGKDAEAAVAALLRDATGIVAVAADPEARPGRPPRVWSLGTIDEALILDGSSFPVLTPQLLEREPVGAWDAKSFHRLLIDAGVEGPGRWACARLTEQLIGGGRWWPKELADASERLGLPEPPTLSAGLEAMVAHTRGIARLITAQIDELKRDQLTRVSRIEAGAVAAVAEMEHQGMALDASAWRDLAARNADELSDCRRQLGDIFGKSQDRDLFGDATLNFESDAELKTALKAIGHDVPNAKRTTLAALPAPLGPLLEKNSKLSKLVSTYGESFLANVKADGRVHPTFEQIGASTGRMACHEPNLQAVVKSSGFRDCFSPPAGRILVIADYATCELRVLAQMSGDPVFKEAFERGDDLHATVATSMFGQPVSKDENPELRQRAKAINFGLVYGMSSQGLARTLETDNTTARELLDRYFRTFPKIREYLESSARAALRRGHAHTLTGRRLYLDENAEGASRGGMERLAKNMPIQGTSADMTKLALGKLRTGLRDFDRAWLVNTVHDEIVVECDESQAPGVRDAVVAAMSEASKEILPDIPAAVDAELSRAWNK